MKLKSCCAGLLEDSPLGVGVDFMHQTAKEFMSRQEIWDIIFGNLEDVSLIPNLAFPSGYIGLFAYQPEDLHCTAGDASAVSLKLARDMMCCAAEADAKLGWKELGNDVKKLNDLMVDSLGRILSFYLEASTSWDRDLFTFTRDYRYFNIPNSNILLNCHIFEDFMSYTTQYGMSLYIELKLSVFEGDSHRATAQHLLPSVIALHYYGRTLALHKNHRVVCVLLDHGASPDLPSLKGSCPFGVDSRDGKRTLWMVLLGVGYSTFLS
jgi:hypothetical protein